MSNKVDKKIAEKIDAEGEAEKDYVRLSSGVELYVKQANPNILIRIMTASKRPDPPQVFMKDMGRYMENSDDPDYIARVKAWEMEYNSGMLNALVALGTSLKSKPKDLPSPESDAWIADYKALGLPAVPESKAWRYMTWVLFVAAPKDVDMKAIGDAVKKLSGVREADVSDAETFPGSDEAGG
jgi:hypothetical protein